MLTAEHPFSGGQDDRHTPGSGRLAGRLLSDNLLPSRFTRGARPRRQGSVCRRSSKSGSGWSGAFAEFVSDKPSSSGDPPRGKGAARPIGRTSEWRRFSEPPPPRVPLTPFDRGRRRA